MATLILIGTLINESEDSQGAALYCSTTRKAFGPLFDSEELAHDFITFVEEQEGCDPRHLTPIELDRAHREFLDTRSLAKASVSKNPTLTVIH